ncbi:MAG: RND family transporter [Halanaerobiales bacterium]|nr:RND family transporter [Halanaerobiales bacterium]
MCKYVDFVKNNRKPLFAILIIINLLALVGIFHIKINPNFEVFMPDQSEYKEVLDEMNQVFSTSDQIMFLVESEGSELTTAMIQEFRDFQKYLENIDNIESIKGPTPSKLAVGPNIIDLEEISEIDLHTLKMYNEKIGTLSQITKKDGKIYAGYTLFTKDDFSSKDIKGIESYLKDRQIKYYASGDLYMQKKILDYVLMILLFLPPTALILILTIFRLQMGSMKATFLSVLPAGIGALWTLGLVGWIGKEVSIITVLAPIFAIVIGSADGLHFVSHVQDERSDGVGDIESIVETLKMVGVPMIITTVTSMAGFLSLLVMNTNAIKDLALFASVGILLAGVVTWYVLPLILTGGVALSRPKKQRKIISDKIQKLWGLPSIAILIVILVISFFGARQVQTEFNQLMFYRSYTDVYKSFDKIMEVNHGTIPVFIYAKTDGDPLNPSFAKELLALEDELMNSKYVGKAMSVYDFYSIMYSIFMNQEKKQYPEQMMQINFINSIISEMDSDPTNHLIDREQKVTRLMIFPVDLKNSTLDEINKLVAEFNKTYDNIEVKVTGVQYLMRELNEGMIDNQTKSLILAFALIFILLFISLRKFKPSFIALLPIAFTVVILYGFLGLTGISLNVFTTTIFSITIGVGIDYAIHFTSVWMSFRKKGYDPQKAVEQASKYTSRPILANAFGLAIGLSALLLSPLRIHLYVSVLMWASMISSVFLSLSFLPTMLRWTKDKDARKSTDSMI